MDKGVGRWLLVSVVVVAVWLAAIASTVASESTSVASTATGESVGIAPVAMAKAVPTPSAVADAASSSPLSCAKEPDPLVVAVALVDPDDDHIAIGGTITLTLAPGDLVRLEHYARCRGDDYGLLVGGVLLDGLPRATGLTADQLRFTLARNDANAAAWDRLLGLHLLGVGSLSAELPVSLGLVKGHPLATGGGKIRLDLRSDVRLVIAALLALVLIATLLRLAPTSLLRDRAAPTAGSSARRSYSLARVQMAWSAAGRESPGSVGDGRLRPRIG